MQNHEILVPVIPREEQLMRKDLLSRLTTFANWLSETGRRWDQPDLSIYHDFLQTERHLSLSSINAHLSTIRSRYRQLLADGTIRSSFENMDPGMLRDMGIDEAIQRIEESINDKRTLHKIPRVKPNYLRPKSEQIAELLNSPDLSNLQGLRDKALLSLMFTTGLRENEVCKLDVEHLEQANDSGPVLHIPPGLGCVERFVPYGRLTWGLTWTKEWLEAVKITDGPVFRGFYKHGYTIRPSRFSSRAVQQIFASYPVHIGEEIVTFCPMDLRRAHARLLYEAGLPLEDIKARLGLKDSNALTEYIGTKEMSLDTPPDVDFFDASQWEPER